MKTMRLIARIDDQHQLNAEVPAALPPGSVEILVVLPPGSEPARSAGWMEAVGREWEAELGDPRDELYSHHDGEAIHVAR